MTPVDKIAAETRDAETARSTVYMPLAIAHDVRGFSVESRSFPGCVGTGATRSEAIANFFSAASAWCDGARRLGRSEPFR